MNKAEQAPLDICKCGHHKYPHKYIENKGFAECTDKRAPRTFAYLRKRLAELETK